MISRYRTPLILAGVMLCAGLALSLNTYRTAGQSLDYARELVSPGFLFIAAMCCWMLRRPKSMLPLQAIVFFLMLPLLGGICGTALHLADVAFPLKWDGALYRLDGVLGGLPPAWVLGQMFHGPIGHWAMQTVYDVWAIMVVLCWLLHRVDPEGRARELLLTYGANLAIGCALFLILPATGPAYAFPGFPFTAPRVSAGLMAVHAYPNSVPSLHMSGAIILLYYGLRVMRSWRAVWWIYAAGTALSTLALGEHYLIDLMLAVPFACFAIALVERRWHDAGLSLAIVIGCMLGIRWGWIAPAPSTWWGLAVVTASSALQIYFAAARSDSPAIAAGAVAWRTLP